jgi:hypothetical protein
MVLQQAHPNTNPSANVATTASRILLTYTELELPAQPYIGFVYLLSIFYVLSNTFAKMP